MCVRVSKAFAMTIIPVIIKILISCFLFFPPAPHQPRLDWQMWFAALESYIENPWFLSLLHKLLLGQTDVLHLMGKSPFSDTPPRFIRAQLYLYHYTQNTSSLWQVLFHPR